MEALIQAYMGTKYIVFDSDIAIAIGGKNDALNALLAEQGVSEWSFITAYNPYSKILDKEQNLQRHQELVHLTADFKTLLGHGVGEDPAWEPELSLLILGISKEAAITLGKHFEQNAIVYGSIDSVPQLLVFTAAS